MIKLSPLGHESTTIWSWALNPLSTENTYPSRSMHRDKRNNTQCIGDHQSYDTLVYKCDLSNRMDQSVGDGQTHALKMPLRMAGPLVDEPTSTVPTAPRSQLPKELQP